MPLAYTASIDLEDMRALGEPVPFAQKRTVHPTRVRT